MGPIAILTSSARSHAQSRDLLQPLAELRLSEAVTIGDMVCLVHEGVRHNFSVVRRSWVAEKGDLRLEVLLDYPARPGPSAR